MKGGGSKENIVTHLKKTRNVAGIFFLVLETNDRGCTTLFSLGKGKGGGDYMVCYGITWYGIVWYGMVRYGMV